MVTEPTVQDWTANPRVAGYLADVDVEVRRLPRRRRVVLRQQIHEHVEEAVRDCGSPDEVTAALNRIGPARVLVDAEIASIGSRRRRVYERLRDWGWHRWAIVALVVAALGSFGGYALDMYQQPQLRDSGLSGWYDLWSANHAHHLNNFAGDETRAPVHVGHVQGMIIGVVNESDSPATVTGTDFPPAEGNFGRPSVQLSTLSMNSNGDPREIDYVPSVTIPPGGARYVRVAWMSPSCGRRINGLVTGSDQVQLSVKIGWFTHHETVRTAEAWSVQVQHMPRCHS